MNPDEGSIHWPFARRPVCLGVIHLPPLPGGPRPGPSMPAIRSRALDEARQLADAGFDGLIIENFGDAPFLPSDVEPHTLTAMAVIVADVCRSVDIPVGVNVLRNDARGALAVSVATGAAFIRVNVHTGVYATDQGLIEGRAAQTLRYRRHLACPTAIFADVHVKHAAPLGPSDLAIAAEETAYRGLADALIVTGTTTGRATSLDDLRTVKSAVPDRPVLVGSGATPETVAELLRIADGVIVGTCLKRDGLTVNPPDPDRVRRFARAAGLAARG